ncbi:MAG: helix-turn-helix transcriptional regulator [Cyanobacteria bacterium SBC]|nr:helix-turn-helix transcriptional regulator [Cyanobacteria bacterium SBC]
MNIGKAIVTARQARCLSVKDLATQAGISRSYLRELEAGKKQPNLDKIEAVSSALGLPTSTLMWLAEFLEDSYAPQPDDSDFVNALLGMLSVRESA